MSPRAFVAQTSLITESSRAVNNTPRNYVIHCARVFGVCSNSPTKRGNRVNEFLEQLQFGGANVANVLGNLTLSLILGLLTAFVYRKTHAGFSYSRGFVISLVSVTMTLTLIMMVIGNYIALSLGLVGALSVVRFRSAIKDPRDIAYIFLAIAIGLACATGNYALSIVGALFINAVLLVLHYTRYGAAHGDAASLSFALDEAQHDLADIEADLQAGGVRPSLRSYTQMADGPAEVTYAVAPLTAATAGHIQALGQRLPGVTRIALLSAEGVIEP